MEGRKRKIGKRATDLEMCEPVIEDVDIAHLFKLGRKSADEVAAPKLQQVKGRIHYLRRPVPPSDLQPDDDLVFRLSCTEPHRPLYLFVARLPGTQGAWLPHIALLDTGELDDESLRQAGYQEALFQKNNGRKPSPQTPLYGCNRFTFNFPHLQALAECWPQLLYRIASLKRAAEEKEGGRGGEEEFELDAEGSAKVRLRVETTGEVHLSLVTSAETASGGKTDGWPFPMRLGELGRLVYYVDAVYAEMHRVAQLRMPLNPSSLRLVTDLASQRTFISKLSRYLLTYRKKHA